MKKVLTICLIVAASLATLAWAADAPIAAPSPSAVVSGVVLEVKDVDSYTYLRLKTKNGETWAAVGRASLKIGASVTIDNTMVMTNFESKTLKKTFPSIVFGTLAGNGKDASSPHAGAPKIADTGPIKVSKATGPNARTVAEVLKKSAELKDKQVQIHAKVVKFNPAIMGKNWVHLRDGTGLATDNTNDILVTTSGQAKVGDVVTVTGTVRVDKDFGSGYAYKVLIEDGKIEP